MGLPLRRTPHQQALSQKRTACHQRRQPACAGHQGQYGRVCEKLGKMAAEMSSTPVKSELFSSRNERLSVSANDYRKSGRGLTALQNTVVPCKAMLNPQGFGVRSVLCRFRHLSLNSGLNQ